MTVTAVGAICALLSPCWVAVGLKEIGEAVQVVEFRDAVAEAMSGALEVRADGKPVSDGDVVARELLRVGNISPSHRSPRDPISLEIVPASGEPMAVRLCRDMQSAGTVWVYWGREPDEAFVGMAPATVFSQRLAPYWKVTAPPGRR